MFNLIAFAVLPFLQIGFDFYASGAVALALVMFVKWRKEAITGIVSQPIKMLMIALAVVMPLQYSGGFDEHDVVRVMREVLVLLLLVATLPRVQERFDEPLAKRTMLICVFMVFGYFGLEIIQVVMGMQHKYFGIPQELFVANEGTLPGDLALIYDDLRPTGTFGEPSYFGFIMFSLTFALLPVVDRWNMAWIAILAMPLIAILSKSLTFCLAIGMLYSYVRPGFKRINFTLVILLAVVAVIGVGIFWDVFEKLFERLGSISDQSSEKSGFVRLYGPLSIMPDFLMHFWLGVPYYKLLSVLEEYVPEGILPLNYTDNALLDFLFFYGFYGFVLLVLYFQIGRDATSRIYLFFCAVFNGGLLLPDKFGVMVLSFSLYNSFSQFVGAKETKVLAGEDWARRIPGPDREPTNRIDGLILR